MIKRSITNFMLGTLLLLPVAAKSEVFSIVVMTDSQFYAERHPEILEAQIDWIVANQVAENIIYVAQTGDIKDDQFCDDKTVFVGTGAGRTEWQIADDAFDDLDTANIPYGVLPGNHEFDPLGGFCPSASPGSRPLTQYDTRFGPARFAGDPFYGDPLALTPGNRVGGSNEDNFTLFDSNGIEFIAINLAYRPAPVAAGLANPELAWADNLLKTYPDRIGIVTSHYFMETNPGNALGPYGQAVYDTLSNNPNLFMMLAGHWYGEAWLTETTGRAGLQPTQIMMANYQGYEFPDDGDPTTPVNTPDPALINFSSLSAFRGGAGATDAGFMRIMRFDTDTGMADIETFIPPVVPIKNRTGTIVSTYFPASAAGVGEFTASNLSVPFYGYGFGYIPPTEMLGLRDFSGTGASAFLLTFSAVKNVTEDRTIIHFDISSYPSSFSAATLNIGIVNIDPGPGTLDVFSFAGDGTVSPDEWNAGTLVETVGGITSSPDTFEVDITSELSTAITNGDNFLSFRLSHTDVTLNRYWLDATVGGVTTAISSEGPTFISITP